MLGTPADWLEQLDRWRTTLGVEWFVLRCRVPLGPAAEQVLECIQRLGEEVLPRLREVV